MKKLIVLGFVVIVIVAIYYSQNRTKNDNTADVFPVISVPEYTNPEEGTVQAEVTTIRGLSPVIKKYVISPYLQSMYEGWVDYDDLYVTSFRYPSELERIKLYSPECYPDGKCVELIGKKGTVSINSYSVKELEKYVSNAEFKEAFGMILKYKPHDEVSEYALGEFTVRNYVRANANCAYEIYIVGESDYRTLVTFSSCDTDAKPNLSDDKELHKKMLSSFIFKE